VGCSSEDTGVVLGWRGLDGGGEVVEVLWPRWVAFGSFGVFVLMVFWVLEVARRCGEMMLWCSGGELVFWWQLVFALLVCG
jgi:hypothetical protein